MPEDQTKSIQPYLALGIALLCIGFSPIFIRWAEAPGIVTSFYRMLIAVVVLLPAFSLQVRLLRALPGRGIWLAALAGVLFAGDLCLWATGIDLSGATNPTILGNTAPIWVGLGAVLIFKERQGWRFWLGLFIAMLGAIFIIGLDTMRGFNFGVGTLMGLGAGIFYGGFMLVAQLGRRYLPALSFLWLSSLACAAVMLAASLLLGFPLWGFSTQTYLSFLGVGLVVQVLAWGLINYTQGHLPASVVSPTLLGQPILTAVLSVWLLGEYISGWQVLGGTLTLLGIFIGHLGWRLKHLRSEGVNA